LNRYYYGSRAFAVALLDRAKRGEDISEAAIEQALRCTGDIPRADERTERRPVDGGYQTRRRWKNNSLDR
jgi:hypothetical protein